MLCEICPPVCKNCTGTACKDCHSDAEISGITCVCKDDHYVNPTAENCVKECDDEEIIDEDCVCLMVQYLNRCYDCDSYITPADIASVTYNHYYTKITIVLKYSYNTEKLKCDEVFEPQVVLGEDPDCDFSVDK
jgi:hypothetical protein